MKVGVEWENSHGISYCESSQYSLSPAAAASCCIFIFLEATRECLIAASASGHFSCGNYTIKIEKCTFVSSNSSSKSCTCPVLSAATVLR